MAIRAGLCAAGIAIVALALAGCTGLFPPESDPAASTPPTSPSPSSSPDSASAVDAAAPELQRGDTVATGKLRSVRGDTTATVRVEYMQPAEYKLVWEDYESDFADVAVELVDTAPVGDCLDEGQRLEAGGGLNSDRDQTSLVGRIPGLMDDPSWLNAVVLTARDIDGCINTIVASADLTWTMPDQRPELGALTDHGATESAAGTARVKNGTAVSYLVEYGDSMLGIAERFGTTVADLEYLNPARDADPTHYVDGGERLNLSRAAR